MSDSAAVSSGTVSDPYVPGLHHPNPPAETMCCGGSSSVPSGNVLQGNGVPVAAPPDPTTAALYTDLDTGTVYTWNVVTQTWQ